MKEHNDDHDYQCDGFEQCFYNRLNARLHEASGVVDKPVIQAWREISAEIFECSADLVRDLQRVSAWQLVDGEGDGGFVVQQRTQSVFSRRKFDSGDIPQMSNCAIRASFENDVAELVYGLQATLGIDCQLHRSTRRRRRSTNGTSSNLDVLFLNGSDNLRGGEITLCHLLRIEPHTHCVVTCSPHIDTANARYPLKARFDIPYAVVPQIRCVVPIIW